jgi:photosystem II stability/assembly factor-like uncharacterized protein
LFRTTDSGATWTPITDGKVPLGSTGSVAVADSDPNVIYLGTGSDGVRSNVSTGRGMYKSTDGGQTWKFIGLYNAGQIGAVAFIRQSRHRLGRSDGDVFKAKRRARRFKTTDGGQTWRKVLFISDGVGAMDVELQPGNPESFTRGCRGSSASRGRSSAVARRWFLTRALTAANTFTKISNGLPNELIGKANLAVTAQSESHLRA